MYTNTSNKRKKCPEEITNKERNEILRNFSKNNQNKKNLD